MRDRDAENSTFSFLVIVSVLVHCIIMLHCMVLAVLGCHIINWNFGYLTP